MFLIKSSRLLEQDLRPLIESIRASQLFSDEVCSDFAERCHGYLMDDHDRLNSIIKIQANIDPIREAMRENAELISVGGGDSEGGLDSSGVSARDLISELRQERNQLKVDLLHDLVRFLDLDSLAPGEFRIFSRAIMDLGSSSEPWETEDFSSLSIGSTSFVMGELIKVPWMSAPIGTEVLDFFSKEPDEHELILPVIAAIHRDYLDSWNDYATPLINSYHATDPEDTYQDEVPIDWEASAIEVDARRAAARDSMRSIDSEFFADLLSIAPSEMAPSIHLLRYERFVDLALAGSGYEPRTFEHAPLKQSSNVVAVLCDLDLPPAVHSLIVSRLSSELDGLLLAQEAIYKERASLSMKNRQRMRGHLAMAESGESETMPAESFQERYGNFNPLGALPALRVQVADSERALTDKVVGLLPEEMHDRFHHELRIRCYPAVYLPDDRIESAFEVIERSEDISPEQMDEIGVLIDAFTREWMRFGDQIIECKESIPSLDALGVGDQMSSMMEYSTRSEQLFFDRGELAMMTLRRIAEVLDSRQQLQIPALQELSSSQQPISSQLQVEASLDEP